MTDTSTRLEPASTTWPDPPQLVDVLLRDELETARRRAEAFGPEYALIWSEIDRSVRGGKRFRSSIVLRTHDALGGRCLEAAVLVAAGFELLHTAFLIHDDLIDRDTVRRGAPNLAATLRNVSLALGADEDRARRWSDASAVLAGDLALSRAHRLIASVDIPGRQRMQLLDLLDETLLVSAGGELADTAFGLGLHLPTLDEAILVCESKTAMYSFRAPLRAGAVLAGAGDDVLVELDDIGRLLGRAFQLVDDLLGVFAPEEKIGKSNVSDLREGKHTALILHARTLPVWDELESNLGREDLDQVTAARMRWALAHSAAPVRVEEQVREDLDDVIARLTRRPLPPEMAAVVEALVSQVRDALDDVVGHVEEARCQAG
ncbi:polyprenyl synthetase family protein [Actinotalea sp. K2]|uniref:polyprenyl synthetase family protein n=1 Tax=Actinotalea sp. K2 TaxID=2939438 RepID=UPI002016B44A|nr:polyprenyl synthetase family protein [Actinotalea sp. K2]MCL3859728.1 polyprenyl synthetase family protein [Actinotalea sp. K2]